MIDLIHAHKLLVSIWTVDKQNQGQKYQKRGVDFITSNEITLLNR
jgi:glycerophosphoryl diester phosphodiesterase